MNGWRDMIESCLKYDGFIFVGHEIPNRIHVNLLPCRIHFLMYNVQ